MVKETGFYDILGVIISSIHHSFGDEKYQR